MKNKEIWNKCSWDKNPPQQILHFPAHLHVDTRLAVSFTVRFFWTRGDFKMKNNNKRVVFVGQESTTTKNIINIYDKMTVIFVRIK
jgi:hypothetical protein